MQQGWLTCLSVCIIPPLMVFPCRDFRFRNATILFFAHGEHEGTCLRRANDASAGVTQSRSGLERLGEEKRAWKATLVRPWRQLCEEGKEAHTMGSLVQSETRVGKGTRWLARFRLLFLFLLSVSILAFLVCTHAQGMHLPFSWDEQGPGRGAGGTAASVSAHPMKK